MAKYYAKHIEKHLQPDTDVIFTHSAVMLAYLKTDKIKVLYSDSNFHDVLDYYSMFSGFSPKQKELGDQIEQDAINNCDLVLYSSDWAANGAKNNYKIINPDKIKVIPFGANIESSRTKDDIVKIVENKNQNDCNLLFIGVDWERKGGNIALDVAKKLYEKGIKVHLDILGIKNFSVELPDYVKNHGFVSKSDDAGRKKIDSLFEKAHFFILPTRADCTPIVFCECSSFGLPIISTNTGGVASCVSENKNGKLFELSDNSEKYVEYIQKTLADFETYKKLCLTSFEQYETRLNWKVAGDKIFEYLRELEQKKR
jgi:glycosyltransferase involved in cell wall biosynthesis